MQNYFDFNRSENEYTFGASYFYNSELSDEADITYLMPNYKSVLNAMIDSIRSNLKPKDIIKISFGKPRWENLTSGTYWEDDTEMIIPIDEIARKDREETRLVETIRYDLIASDKFGVEFFSQKDLTYQLNNPLGIDQSFMFLGNLSTKYSRNSRGAVNYERARNLASSSDVRVLAVVKGVAFTDGTVLKDETLLTQ